MAATGLTQQFSDEKILADPTKPGDGVDVEKEAVTTKASDLKTSTLTDDKAIIRPAIDEKETLKTHSNPAEEKQPLPQYEEKISLRTSERDDKEQIPEGTPSAVSLTHSSWSQFTSTSYQEHSFCHVNALRLNHNVVVDPNGQANYFIEVTTSLMKGREDVSIRRLSPNVAEKGTAVTAEEGKACPVVGFAQFPDKRDNFIQLALGSPNDMRSVRWIDLSRTSEKEDWTLFVPGKPGQTFQLATNADSSSGTRNASPVSPLDNKSSTGSFKVIDIETRALVAAYIELKTMSSWKKRGKLRLYERALASIEGAGPDDLQLLVILCCAVMNEKRRRKTVRKWAGIGIV